MSATYIIKIDQGTDYGVTLRMKDNTGAVINLTGCTIAGDISRVVGSPIAAEFDFDLSTLGIGEIPMSLSHSVTTELEGTYFYDIKLTWPSTLLERIIEGQLIVDPQVTI